MADPTASDIYNKLGLMIDDWQTFLDENIEWLGGASYEDDPNPPDGDPANAGKRYVTDSTGNRMLVWTPNSLNDIADSFQGNYDELVIYINAELDKTNLATAAMSKAEFDAQREANNNLFAQSGFVHFGEHYDNNLDQHSINEGLCTVETSPNVISMGRNDHQLGTSKTNFAQTHIAGVISDLIIRTDNRAVDIKFPEAPDGTVTYDSATGEVTQHADSEAAFLYANTSDDIEVVINRHDMFGFEAFLREITDADPFAYPKGMSQSQATTMNGVATVDDSVRPITYFAVFDGDTTSQGKGVNWFTATNAQKKAIVSDPKNNIYYDAETGKWYQWCLRQRTIAGAGNGDWSNTSTLGDVSLDNTARVKVRPQGVADTEVISNDYLTASSGAGNLAPDNSQGMFSARGTGTVAVNGECYFYVMGTVKRLNQGAYHPSFNPLGSAKWAQNNGTVVNGYQFWHEGNVIEPHATSDAFRLKLHGDANITQAGKWTRSDGSDNGPISGEAGSGRSDGRYYDGIYASGQGGVNDDRMTAWDMGSPEEAAKIQAKVENGTYRGEEKLGWTGCIATNASTVTTGNPAVIKILKSAFELNNPKTNMGGVGIPCTGSFTYPTTGEVFEIKSVSEDETYYYIVHRSNTVLNTSDRTVTDVVITTYLNQTVSGEFEMVTLWGDPAKLLIAHPQGWQGDWGGLTP